MDAHFLNNLPTESGIYLYWDAQKRLLYVGKAKNLKKRILSYFKIVADQVLPNAKSGARVQKMVRQIQEIQWRITTSEEEALLLENEYIKKHQPKYNILLKDDKTYPYICVDLSMPYPVFGLSRKVKSGLQYFGPFSSAAKEILDSLLDFLPLVQSRACLRGKKACVFYEMRRCCAPCENKISPQEYGSLIQVALGLLEDKSKLLNLIEQRMRTLALQERFEEAIIYRERHQKIQALLARSQMPAEKLTASLRDLLGLKMPPNRIEIFDVSHHAQSHCVGGMVVFEKGSWVKNAYRRYALKGKDEYAQMQEMLERRVKSTKYKTPDLWLLDGGKTQVHLAEQILKKAGLETAVVGIAKAKIKGRTQRAKGDVPDTLHTSEQTLHPSPKNTGLQFLQRLRDEAHRYALSYHHKRKTKAMISNPSKPPATF